LALIVALASACGGSERSSGERRYAITGEVVAVDARRGEVTIAHDAVAGYMAAMVMPFKVRDAELAGRLQPGDLVRGSLVVSASDGFIETIERTGHRAAAGAPPGRAQPGTKDFVLEGDALPEVELVDQDGATRSLRSIGGMQVMTFVYTRCPFPTFCPLMDRHFKSLQATILADSRLAGRVRLLSITIDPDHDTPAVLRGHAAKVGADPRVWTFVSPRGLRGSEIADRLGVAVEREAPASPLIVHGLVTVVSDDRGVVERIFRGNEWTPREVGALLASMLDRTS
jgi:protein SCO1/2